MANDFLIESGNIGSDYAVASEGSGPRFPWLQSSTYKPANAKSPAHLGLVRDSVNVSGSDVLDKALEWTEVSYDDEGTPTEFGAVTEDVRWIILTRPRLFGMVKADGKIVDLTKGMKERGEVTVSQVLLACVVGGDLIKDENGDPQIFTLKLRSSKTALLGSERDKDFGASRNGGHKTIAQLNAALVERAGVKPGSWMGHTVSIQFASIAEKFTSASNGDSSMGVRFVFAANGGARPLPTSIVKDIHQFITTPDFKALAANPFAKPEQKEEVTETYTYEVEASDDDLASF